MNIGNYGRKGNYRFDIGIDTKRYRYTAIPDFISLRFTSRRTFPECMFLDHPRERGERRLDVLVRHARVTG